MIRTILICALSMSLSAQAQGLKLTDQPALGLKMPKHLTRTFNTFDALKQAMQQTNQQLARSTK